MSQKYEFKILKTEDLEIVDFNPNEMSKSQIAHLKKTIKERGFMQPITVTPKEGEKDKYVVIDGAHRLNVFKELQRSVIPCYIVPDKKSIDIKIDLINLNKIKGEFNQKKYAALLESLNTEIGKQEIKSLLNLEEEELKAYMNIANNVDDDLKGTKEVSFSVRDIQCPKCSYKGPKADFKIK